MLPLSGSDWEDSVFIPKAEFNSTLHNSDQTLGVLYPCLEGRFSEWLLVQAQALPTGI